VLRLGCSRRGVQSLSRKWSRQTSE